MLTCFINFICNVNNLMRITNTHVSKEIILDQLHD